MSCEDSKSVQKMSKDKAPKRHGKTDLRYWREVVFRPTCRSADGTRELEQFYVKIQFQGRRETFPLRTNNQEAAADFAKKIFMTLVSKGWEQALLELKPNRKKVVKPAIATVGDLIQAVMLRHDVARRTVADYARALRHVAAQSLGLGWGNGKISVADQKRWVARIDAIALQELTAKSIESWRQKCLAAASGKGPVALRHAKNTLNSHLRKTKALFSSKFLRHLDMGANFSNPFEGIVQEPRQSMRYQSRVDLDRLIATALHGDDGRQILKLPVEQLKAFLLAGLVGLRRNEIDKLEWSCFLWNDNLIRLQTTDHFQPKTEESLADVDVDVELMELFKELCQNAQSTFVVESPVKPRSNASYAHYRCDAVFARLTKWLKNEGVPGITPIHTLRKEFGSLMCSRYGIYVASRALRHRDIYITSQHYLDTKKRLAPGLSSGLQGFRPTQEDGDLP